MGLNPRSYGVGIAARLNNPRPSDRYAARRGREHARFWKSSEERANLLVFHSVSVSRESDRKTWEGLEA
jgi:hypothetical protein